MPYKVPVTSAEIRADFLSFFESKGCKLTPSSSLIPDDPSLLLTAAGMVQFKPYFLGTRKLDALGAVSCQKCVRTTDIDVIGFDGRHLSFFEMLGNFSFGGYGKVQACEWAYEFITQHLQLPLEKLYFSIYLDDEEAHDIWANLGIAEDHIVRLGEEDNFWAAGPTGPCGPCSEVYYDQGPAFSDNPDCKVGDDDDRFLEFWNLVFTQFNRQEDGTLLDLPSMNIDTGMGLERISAIMQHASSNYDGDILRGLITLGEELTGVSYGTAENSNRALRIMADHARAVTFMISDGILPSNEGRGYVLRRLLRRAVRYGQLMGVTGAFLNKYVDMIIDIMGEFYPGIVDNSSLIHSIVTSEEERFGRTLNTGSVYLETALSELSEGEVLSGKTAFELHDTYGFPFDLTVEMAAEAGHEVDKEVFHTEMEAQKTRARSQVKDTSWGTYESALAGITERIGATEFVGYTENECEAHVIAILNDKGELVEHAVGGDSVEVILDKTPFYARRGGQIGDTGTIKAASFELEVSDTIVAEKVLNVHQGTVIEGTITVGDSVTATIDIVRRAKISRNHTATHLLHWALREVLGDHVTQAGSLVAQDRLRFDFTHFEGVSASDLTKIESLVNELIMMNAPVSTTITTLEGARAQGAMALFGEKYGDEVRLLSIGNFSRELCGGTHVKNLAEIGFIKILSESSTGSNVRRIEAVSSFEALHYVEGLLGTLQSAAVTLGVSLDAVGNRVAEKVEEIKELEREKAAIKANSIKESIQDILDHNVSEAGGFPLVVARLDGLDADGLRSAWDVIRESLPSGAAVIGTKTMQGSPMLLAAATQEAVDGGFNAGKVIKGISKNIKGGGGGKPTMAQAGGKDAAGIDGALDAAREMFGC